MPARRPSGRPTCSSTTPASGRAEHTLEIDERALARGRRDQPRRRLPRRPGRGAAHGRARLRRDRQHELQRRRSRPSPATPTTPRPRPAILALTRAMAHDLGARGVRVHAICPGDVASYAWDNVELARLYRSRIAAGRSAAIREVVAVYLHLASDDAPQPQRHGLRRRRGDAGVGVTALVTGGARGIGLALARLLSGRRRPRPPGRPRRRRASRPCGASSATPARRPSPTSARPPPSRPPSTRARRRRAGRRRRRERRLRPQPARARRRRGRVARAARRQPARRRPHAAAPPGRRMAVRGRGRSWWRRRAPRSPRSRGSPPTTRPRPACWRSRGRPPTTWRRSGCASTPCSRATAWGPTTSWPNVELGRLYDARIAIGRSAVPPEIAAAYAYLAGAGGVGTTGTALIVDGGMLAWE